MKSITVSFNEQVRIRNHAITLGDNPACSFGTPVTMDWDLVDDETVVLSLSDLEAYQERRYASAIEDRQRLRSKNENAPHGPPIKKLGYYERVKMLQRAGYSHREINESEREVKKIQEERNSTKAESQPSGSLGNLLHKMQKSAKGKRTKGDRRRAVKGWYSHYGKRDKVSPSGVEA